MKVAIVILSVLLASAIYMWISKPVTIVNTGTERITELQVENDALKLLLTDTLEYQDLYYQLKLSYSDSVILAKKINNWNLIVKYEKEIERYKFISTDSIYVSWLKESSTRFN